MQRKIKILVVKPNKLPEVQIIDNNDRAKKEIVGGSLNYIYDDNFNNVVFICNGNKMNLTANRLINNKMITGTFIIVRDDYEYGEDRSLTEKQIKKYQDFFNEKSIFDTNLLITQKKVEKQDLAI